VGLPMAIAQSCVWSQFQTMPGGRLAPRVGWNMSARSIGPGPRSLVCLVRLVCLAGLDKPSQGRLVPDAQVSEVLLCRKGFQVACNLLGRASEDQAVLKGERSSTFPPLKAVCVATILQSNDLRAVS
jgi:hypothetical protein